MKNATLVLLAGAGMGLALVGCPTTTDAPCEGAACANGGDGGGDGTTDGGGVDAPPGCDPAADVKDAPKCVVNEFGVFVDSASGNDSNPGTRESPVKTIGAAAGKLGGKPRIYVCDGTYAEHVKLTSAVSIYGGFACGSWDYSAAKPKIAPSDKGYALELRGATSDVVLSDLDMAAKDATEKGESSIGAFIVSSTKVIIRRSSISAGKGVDGADGAAPTDFTPATAPKGTDGTAAVNPGAATPNPQCNTSVGGAGGKNGAGMMDGSDGKVAPPPGTEFPKTYTGTGGSGGKQCNLGAGGTGGSYGTAGQSGSGAPSVGQLTAEGWKGNDGASGGNGGDGQGGGGGAQIVLGGGGVGGSGGPGGCGGAGGAKGTAGGSSIALLAFESSINLEQSTLVAKDAGRGGNAAKGQKGQIGGDPGSYSNVNDACAGGPGGTGGSGGGGGGGAGGVSAGIVYRGASPSVDGTALPSADTHATITVGQKGVAGTKGSGGDAARVGSRAGQDGTDGVTGEAKAVLGLQ